MVIIITTIFINHHLQLQIDKINAKVTVVLVFRNIMNWGIHEMLTKSMNMFRQIADRG